MHRLGRIPPEVLAAVISPHIRIDQIVEMKMYLEEVVKAVINKMQWKCAECGRDMGFKDDKLTRTREVLRTRRDARYCSPACRQKAFRKRVTHRAANTTAQPSRTTDIQPQATANP
jgi:hypothetical protein